MQHALLALVICLTINAAFTYQPPPQKEPVQKAKAWYSGGDLHQKTGQDWLAATPENRLATSADFVTAITKPTTLEGIRPRAIALEACISKSFTRPADISAKKWTAVVRRPVTEMASACAVLMKLR